MADRPSAVTEMDRPPTPIGIVVTGAVRCACAAQEDVDLWLTTHPTRRRGVGSSIRWTVARRLTSKLVVPREAKSLPSQFLGDEEHHGQLRRCLNDDTLPLEVRVVGALVRLYALPVTRILDLTLIHAYGEHRCLHAPRAALPVPGQWIRGVPSLYLDVLTLSSRTNQAPTPRSPTAHAHHQRRPAAPSCPPKETRDTWRQPGMDTQRGRCSPMKGSGRG